MKSRSRKRFLPLSSYWAWGSSSQIKGERKSYKVKCAQFTCGMHGHKTRVMAGSLDGFSRRMTTSNGLLSMTAKGQPRCYMENPLTNLPVFSKIGLKIAVWGDLIRTTELKHRRKVVYVSPMLFPHAGQLSSPKASEGKLVGTICGTGEGFNYRINIEGALQALQNSFMPQIAPSLEGVVNCNILHQAECSGKRKFILTEEKQTRSGLCFEIQFPGGFLRLQFFVGSKQFSAKCFSKQSLTTKHHLCFLNFWDKSFAIVTWCITVFSRITFQHFIRIYKSLVLLPQAEETGHNPNPFSNQS